MNDYRIFLIFLKKELKVMKWNMISDYIDYNSDILIKSPRYIGGDCMFLYRFVRRSNDV